MIFLDIDGVLNSNRSCIAFGGYPFKVAGPERAMFDEVALGLIRNIAMAAGAQIVLSSSWRLHNHYSEIGAGLGLPIIDRTPSLPGPRGAEIAYWLAEHPEVEQYAIVDDDPDMLDGQMPLFVNTNMSEGFTWRDAKKLCSILGIDIHDVGLAKARLRAESRRLEWDEVDAREETGSTR